MADPVVAPVVADPATPPGDTLLADDVKPPEGDTPKDGQSLLGEDEPTEEEKLKAEADKKAADDAAAALKAAEGPPEKYAFVKPEGFDGELDTAMLAEMDPVLRDLGLNQERAQKLVDAYATRIAPMIAKQLADAQQIEFAKTAASWRDQAKNDPEFGGDSFEANLAHARTAFKRFGAPGLKTLLNDWRLGDNPVLLKTFAAIGKSIAEDNVVRGDGAPQAKSGRVADLMYDPPPAS